MNRSVEQRLLDLYIANVEVIGEGFPAALNGQRREFIEAFNLISLPGRKTENYRLSDMQALFGSREWEHYFTPSRVECTCGELPRSKYPIVVNNGFCGENVLHEFENGLIYGSLRAAAAEKPELVLKYYNSVADNKKESLTALNSAFMQDGTFVYVPDGVELDEPVFIENNYGAGCEDVMGFGRTLLVFGAGSRARVQFVHRTCGNSAVEGETGVPAGEGGVCETKPFSSGDPGDRLPVSAVCGCAEGHYLADYVREVCVGENADVHLSEVTLFGETGHLIVNSYVRQEAGSRCEVHAVDLGEGTARLNHATDIAGERAEARLFGLYLHGNRERCDVNVTVNHLVPHCRSYELVKGVAGGEAVGAFTGKVYVAQDAQKTDAFQQSRNLLLSETAHVYTRPQLEIYADDVKCSHGATVGQLDSDAIYYMRQRGISLEEARKLQLHGFVNDVLSHCCCEGFCDWMTALAEAKIDRL